MAFFHVHFFFWFAAAHGTAFFRDVTFLVGLLLGSSSPPPRVSQTQTQPTSNRVISIAHPTFILIQAIASLCRIHLFISFHFACSLTHSLTLIITMGKIRSLTHSLTQPSSSTKASPTNLISRSQRRQEAPLSEQPRGRRHHQTLPPPSPPPLLPHPQIANALPSSRGIHLRASSRPPAASSASSSPTAAAAAAHRPVCDRAPARL